LRKRIRKKKNWAVDNAKSLRTCRAARREKKKVFQCEKKRSPVSTRKGNRKRRRRRGHLQPALHKEKSSIPRMLQFDLESPLGES